jgi:hypothetical protein
VEDDHVDRPGVEAQQCVQLTGTNRSIGLNALISRCPYIPPAQTVRRTGPSIKAHGGITSWGQFASLRPSPAWWLLRSDKTRSHPELGRQTLQHRWYCVLRPGRVGRCQACEGRRFLFHAGLYRTAGFACETRRLRMARLLCQRRHCRGVEQPGSSSGS